MSKNMLTPEQLQAVSNSGGALLVSAAAGSGKTKVLVERLLKKVMAPGSSCDVDDFLVITFTNAAAAELRGRILSAISERMSDDPANKRLRRQADLCCRAHISTIHGFCTEIIRENAHILGISPEFRIGDETEMAELRDAAVNEALEEFYEAGDADFLALADTMGAGRDDSKLVSAVLDAYNKLMSHPYPQRWIDAQLGAFDLKGDEDVINTVWGRVLADKARRQAEYLRALTAALVDDAREAPDFYASYGPSLENTLAGFDYFLAALDESWDKARILAAVPFETARVSGYDDLKKRRTAIKEAVDKLEKIFSSPSSKLIADLRDDARIIRAFFAVVSDFERRYAEKKKTRGVIDFSDQEHLALNVLVNAEDGTPTEAARELSRRFEEIMVDEYQDVNAVQELIFNAVSKDGKNVFMVGDVKQSIYRFRLADPTIFRNKYKSFANAADAADGEGRKIVLSRNFRSRAGVLDAVNFIFRNIMSEEFGDMDYTDAEALYAGAAFPDVGESAVELDVLDLSDAADDDGETPEKTDAEAQFIAGRIKELIARGHVSDGSGGIRPVRYGDIAILLRSAKGKAVRYAAALAAEGIPVAAEVREDFFSSVEISVTVSLLAVIDNPRQDIPLLAALRSPIFGFTSDELAQIRAGKRDGDFYSALEAAAANNAKCANFMAELKNYRTLAPDMSVEELISYIYNRTGLLAAVSAMSGGEKRRANLMQLFDYAKKFEDSGYKGLFGFCVFLRRLMETGAVPGSDSAPTAENSVRIMSIHKSKGMEFPVVFLADLAKNFNTDDAKAPFIMHSELGVGIKHTDLARRIEYPTVARKAVTAAMRDESFAEEMRILYVAMTRAKEKLIMTVTLKSAARELLRMADVPLPVPPQKVGDSTSYGKWILMTAWHREEAGALRFGAPYVPTECEGERWDIRLISADTDSAPEAAEAVEADGDVGVSDDVLTEFKDKLEYSYPHSAAPAMPSKITATELNGSMKAAEAAEDAEHILKRRRFSGAGRPDFMEDAPRPSSAERGIATHTVMQYAKYAECVTPFGAAAEIERLRRMGIISDRQAAMVKPETVSAFFASDIGKRVLSAERVWRELKFSVLADSAVLGGESGEKILLQGVADCCIEENGELAVVDYKTDYVTADTLAEKVGCYSGQLGAYAMALERMLKKPVKQKILYFLTAGIYSTVE